MRIVLQALVLLAITSSAMADIRSNVKALFEQDMSTLDFARVKIEVDRMIDPRINVDTQLAEIDQMVATIKSMLPRNADSWEKVQTIRRYIYEAGAWNDGRTFSYDHDDPYGLDVRNKGSVPAGGRMTP